MRIVLLFCFLLMACEPQTIEPTSIDEQVEKKHAMIFAPAVDHEAQRCYVRCVMPDNSIVEIKSASAEQIVEIENRIKKHHPDMEAHHTCVIKPVKHPYTEEEMELMRSYE